ncbi:DUF2798 domain-containing protein [Botryobacter ruber]|uniref:DUF2798 domain-containing protein n=1 Tax=Botryobacter ruber TaxID=2171629 RepID=UPI000E0C8469|nr:DUF2798 domain-containing protein [Botryobacter ruber]
MKKSKAAVKIRFKKPLLVIAVLSLLLASAIELYTFGIASDFFTRWLRSFFVVFVLISVTALGIVPGVSFVVNKIVRKFSL